MTTRERAVENFILSKFRNIFNDFRTGTISTYGMECSKKQIDESISRGGNDVGKRNAFLFLITERDRMIEIEERGW